MTDHLPECGYGIELSFDGLIQPAEPCICDRLRQCEQRVADEIWGALREGSQYKSGFEGGLDAAREAVAALDDGTTIPASDGIFEALDAIDALRRVDNE